MRADDPREDDLACTLGGLQRLSLRRGLEFGTATFRTIDAVQVEPGEAVFAHLVVGMRGSVTQAEAAGPAETIPREKRESPRNGAFNRALRPRPRDGTVRGGV